MKYNEYAGQATSPARFFQTVAGTFNKLFPGIPKQENNLCYLLLWMPYIVIYQATNRFPVFAPRYLEFSRLDHAIPFVPALVPVYVSYLLFVFVVISRCRNDEEITRIFYLSYFQVVLAAFVFILFPVSYPREVFYNGNDMAGNFGQFWLFFDKPNNCLPSLHTANSLLAIHFCKGKPRFSFFALWGFLIILSTLLCKQHYMVDVAAGIILYGATLVMEKALFNR